MSSQTVSAYIESLPDDRRKAMKKLRAVIRKNLPKGFEEVIEDVPAYVVPHSVYPDGYHCDPTTPLPFLSMASRKNFIALYHMGIYADPKLLAWFREEWPNHVKTKLDMGKSCIRLKRMDTIPFELIGELVSKMSAQDWIAIYEKVRGAS